MDCTSFCYLEGTSNEYCAFHAKALDGAPNSLPTHEAFLEEILEAIDRGIQNQEGNTDYCVADCVFQAILDMLPKKGDVRDIYEKLLSYRGENVISNL